MFRRLTIVAVIVSVVSLCATAAPFAAELKDVIDVLKM